MSNQTKKNLESAKILAAKAQATINMMILNKTIK